jgi:DNA-binding NarL/FixJ family response regulator
MPAAARLRRHRLHGQEHEARDVLHAIHLASRGLRVLPPAALDGSEAPGPELLTPREAEVLELLQAGRSNAEIAHALHVGVETVRTHARRIYRKLGVKTRRDLRART